MVSPHEAGRNSFGAASETSGLPKDPLFEAIHQTDEALERAILSSMAHHQGLELEEFLEKHPEQSLEPYTLH